MIVALKEISKGTDEGGSQQTSSSTECVDSGQMQSIKTRNLQILRVGGAIACVH